MSKIEWTEKTWNPITGCTRVSPGCEHCYAERMSRRLAAMGQEKYAGLNDHHGRFNGTVKYHHEALDIPRQRKTPTVWFVNSMSDLFHANINALWLTSIWEVMAETPQHTYQILTKRADLMHERARYMIDLFGVLPNVWLGVSVEDQKRADERIPDLLQTPAAVRFLSCEPLLGAIDFDQVTSPFSELARRGIDWVIVGGESGPGARPMHPDWARSIRDQCVEQGVKFFFKQWGAWAPGFDDEVMPERQIWMGKDGSKHLSDGTEQEIRGSGLMSWFETTETDRVLMSRVGKRRSGRLLDGRTWDEMPLTPTLSPREREL